MLMAVLRTQAQEEEPGPLPRFEWTAQTHLGVGYDTNANGSTQEQTFVGFTLDPRFVATESAFAELGLSLEHTTNLSAQSGFISTAEWSHRANPNASFADQTLVALGTEAVLLRGDTRFSAGVSGYSGWLQGHEDERGAHVDLGVSHRRGDLETAFALRTSRLSYIQSDFALLDVDRYLGALTLTQFNIGAHSASVGVTLLGGRDAARRVGSPFGATRIGAQLSANWVLKPQATLYLELSGLQSDYAGEFFGSDREDDQHTAALALEFERWPAEKWTFAPQVRWVRNDSTVTLYSYHRIEAVLYVRRAL
jgi:hypothetical protein